MIKTSLPLTLMPVTTPEQWSAYHRIRRITLFEARGLFDVYDDNHPDDRKEANHPLLLYVDTLPVGVVRVDLLEDGTTAGFRRLAILKDAQRKGYGRALLSLAEGFASRHAHTHFSADVATDAVGFCERIGYRQVATDVPDDGARIEKRHDEA